MKKSFLLAVITLSTTVSVIAQDVNVYWGKFNNEDRKAETVLIGRRGDYLFSYKKSGNNISILKYSMSDLQVKAEYPVLGKAPQGQGGKTIPHDYLFDNLITLKDHFYISVQKYDKSVKQNSLFIQEISPEGRLTGSLKKLESIDAKSRFNRGDFDLIESSDSTKVLLVDYPPYEKYAGEKFTFTMFDQDLNQLKKLQVELPFKDKDFDLDDITYASDGNIYMMAKIFLERGQKAKGEADFYYELIAVTTQGDGGVVQYDVKLPGKKIDGISFSPNDDKDIICSGFYGDMTGTAKGDITGVFFMRINKDTKQVDASGVKALDKDFIADLTSTRRANKGKGISNDFVMRHFIRKSDGGAVLLAEYSYDYQVTVTTSDGHGGMSTTTHYHYVRNNIIAINVNPDGSIKWLANIPKFQHTVDDGGIYNSFALETKDDRMYIIYNDNPDNMDPARIAAGKDLRDMNNPKKSTAILVELDDNGQFTKKALFSNKDNEATLMPAHSLDISKTEIITPAYHPGFWCCFSISPAKSKLARIEFK